LREKLTEKAFIRRACFQNFSYQENPFKISGEVEYRPAKCFPNGTIYLGQWLVGTQIRHGRGASINKNGSLFEGHYKEGYREGPGRMVTEQGVVHMGSYSSEEWDGHGVLQFTDGREYNGNFS